MDLLMQEDLDRAHEAKNSPSHRKRGRKPKGDKPMTAAERQAARAARIRQEVKKAATTLDQIGSPPVDPATGMDLRETWDRRRLDIKQWLEVQAPTLAAIYEATVVNFRIQKGCARLHFVAYGIREIANRLPDCLADTGPGRLDYSTVVPPLVTAWRRAGLPLGNQPMPVPIGDADLVGLTGVTVPIGVAAQIAHFLGEHAQATVRNEEKTEALFASTHKAAGSRATGSAFSVQRWREIRKWAAEHTHLGRPFSETADVELETVFEDFEGILYALIGRFTDVIGETDRLLAVPPTPENVKVARKLLSRGGARNYFCERLDDEDWFRALDDEGYFHAPRENEYWPEAALLRRMANRDPGRVTAILERISDEPSLALRLNLADLALALPPACAAKLAKPIAEIAGASRGPFNFWHNLPQLMVHLAQGGKHDAAFQLFNAMYEVRRAAETEDGDSEVAFPDTSTEFWYFQEGLRICLPALMEIDAPKLFKALCAKTQSAAKAKGYLAPKKDFTSISARHITEGPIDAHHDRTLHDAASLYATAALNVARTAIQAGRLSVEEAIKALQRKDGVIFGYLQLHLLVSIAPEGRDLAVENMSAPEKFEKTSLEEEYGRLLSARYAELSDSQKDKVLAWMRKGPDLEEYARRRKEVWGQEVTPEMITTYKDLWIRDCLKWIPADQLQSSDAALLAELNARLPEEYRDGNRRQQEEPPESYDELTTKPVPEIAEFLKARPAGPDQGLTSQLGSALSQIAGSRAAEFSREARSLIGVHQSWIRSVLWGMDNPAGQNPDIEWAPLLDLCSWVVAQLRGEEPRERYGTGDVSWESARSSVADLLRAGLQNSHAPIPGTLANQLWAVLEVLATDPDPSAEYGQGLGYEPAMLSINTVRGKAMHAVVHYALWRRRNMTEEEGRRGLDAIPEVRTLLNAHLDLEQEPSAGVRSVFAQYYPALVYLDANWAAEIAAILFPAGEDKVAHWMAAWSVYATFARPFDQVFDILRPSYELAVRRMPWSELQESRTRGGHIEWRHAEENVACHLTAFYWRGKLDLANDGLLAQFMGRANPEARSKALWFISNSMASHEGDLPLDVQERLKAFWEWRVTAVAGSNDPEELKELSSFGGWFAYAKLDIQWLAKSLLDLFGDSRLVNHLDHPGMVVERMAEIAKTDVALAVQCLEAFVIADKEGWRHTQAKEDVLTILQSALSSGLPEAIEAARHAIDALAEHGDMTPYRNLLQNGELTPADFTDQGPMET
jgi:hypothetical protein